MKVLTENRAKVEAMYNLLFISANVTTKFVNVRREEGKVGPRCTHETIIRTKSELYLKVNLLQKEEGQKDKPKPWPQQVEEGEKWGTRQGLGTWHECRHETL